MKQIILFLSLLFAVQIGTAQDTWNACNSTVTVIPAPSYDSTFVLEAPSRAALQKGMANWVPASSGGGASYLVYTALLTQSGTSAPVATVLENTLGGTVVWTYNDVGNYSGTLTGAFTTNTLIFPVYAGFNSQLYLDPYTTINNSYFPDAINLQTGEVDSYLNNTLIEIRVY